MEKTEAQKLAQKLIDWEWENGENVLEDRFGSNFDECDFMKWCYKNGRIGKEKYELFLEECKNPYGYTEFHQIVFDDFNEIPYAVVTAESVFDEDENLLDKDKYNELRLVAYVIFADYILFAADGLNKWNGFVEAGEW